MILKSIIFDRVSNGFCAPEKCDFSTNSPNFDEIVHINARWVVLNQDVHGRFELQHFGEVDLLPEIGIPRGCTLEIY